jgi:tetratricopeptide (TPR) repeat protein
MNMRSSAARLALVAVVATTLAGCGIVNRARAMKAFKDGNKDYSISDYRAAVEKYEVALSLDPENTDILFYLANSYDNLYRPARKGEAANDGYLTKAIDLYKRGSEESKTPILRTRSLEYLVAAYGPEKLNDPTLAEPVVKRMIELDPKEPTNYFALAQIYQDSGEYELAEQTLMQAKSARPNDANVHVRLANFYNSQGDFTKTMEAYGERIKVEPTNPEAHYTAATYYWDKASRDFRLTDKEKMQYVQDGMAAINKAIEIKPDYMEAIVYKNLLLRLQANLEKDPKVQQALLKEADTLRDQANELRKQKMAAAAAEPAKK